VRGSKTRSGLNAITDPAVYKRVAELFSQAAELPLQDQAAFLRDKCGSDTDLLRLLQKLLQEDWEGPIEPELAADRPTPAIYEDLSGRTLSHYQIVGPMGAGGMGVVYRATETRLQRTVALKFLPPLLRDDSASRERLIREARVIASIDHQNVCPVYEIEEADGFIFIVMACLEGTSLEEKIRTGPISVKQAIGIALQAAYGLQAANAKGVVHRDIKPANLMLTDTESVEPLVRILDFGIAQWTEKTGLTQKGLRIGTVLYMAPEQVAGPRVDQRADIWSLGVVLYQMLLGRVPFEGSTLRETLAAIAGPQAADLTPIREVAPPEVVSILRKMLEKEPVKRYQTASALISGLESVRHAAAPGPIARIARGPAVHRVATVGAIAGLIALSILLFVHYNRPHPLDKLKIVPFTYHPGYEQDPAISPDGKEIAFVGQGKDGNNPFEVYVQLIGSAEPLRLTSVSADSADRSPVWNPSSTRIAFLRTRRGERFARILTTSPLGGAETDLGIPSVLATGQLAWSPDGRLLAFAGATGTNEGAIFELSLLDHSLRQRSFPAPGQTDSSPVYDPSGARLAFDRNGEEIVVIGPGSEAVQALPASRVGFTWTADGRALVYPRFGRLAEVDPVSGSVTEPAAATTLGPDIWELPRWPHRSGNHSVTEVTIRGNRMAFVHWVLEDSIWQLTLHRAGDGRTPEISAEPGVQLIASTMPEDTPQFSPDGEWIAFASERSGTTDIWIGRRDGSGLRRLTFIEGFAGTPRWSPDGQSIAFDLRQRSSTPDIWLVRVAGGETRRLSTNTGGADVPSWSNDGRWIYFHAESDDQIWKIPSQGGKAVPLTRHGGFEGFESMDGKYLYHSKSEEHSGIWRMDLSNGSEAPVPELSGTGDYRQWALGGTGIFFVPYDEAFRKDAAVRFFDFATRRIVRVATVGKLNTAGPGALAVSRDETRLLYVHMDRDNRNIMLVENFK
jgi:serine/threonine protein kinase/dipeptidyl aminopeptidase/acylaminoacyl peptidase